MGHPLPFLKWPGGKRWVAPLLASIVQPELDGTYFEPFVGGASVFLQLQPSKAILSDINEELIKSLKIVRDDPELVVRAVHRLSNTSACYYRVRRMKPRSVISYAARFIYLNRTCWGGIYRLNKGGGFNVPFGRSGRVICKRSSVIDGARALKKAKLRCADFEEVMDEAGHGDVVYADPPYTTRGQNNGFVRYNEILFAWQDQMRLAAACERAAKRGAFVVVSGLWHRDVLNAYPFWWGMQVSRTSTVSREVESRTSVSEALLFSRKPKSLNIEACLKVGGTHDAHPLSREMVRTKT